MRYEAGVVCRQRFSMAGCVPATANCHAILQAAPTAWKCHCHRLKLTQTVPRPCCRLVTWSAPRYLELDSDPALHVPGAQAEGGITPARANEVAATDSSMILACGCKEVGYELARFLEKGFLHG